MQRNNVIILTDLNSYQVCGYCSGLIVQDKINTKCEECGAINGPEEEYKKPEVWGSLTRLCRAYKEFSYHYIKAKEFPFEYKGFRFEKVKFNEKQ